MGPLPWILAVPAHSQYLRVEARGEADGGDIVHVLPEHIYARPLKARSEKYAHSDRGRPSFMDDPTINDRMV